MDKNEKRQVNNPRQGANLLSVITFKWLFGTYLLGNKRELEVEDLYSPLDEHSSRLLGNKMSRFWKEELEICERSNKKSTPSLLRVLVRCFGCDTMLFGIITAIIEFGVNLTQPIILANLLKYFSGKHTMERTEAFYWGTGIVVGIILKCFIMHPTTQGLVHIGMKMRVACCSLIYRKVLKVSKVSAEGETNVGQMINLLSNDVNRLDYSVFQLHYIWIAPIETALISYLLYREVNLAAVGGILILLLFIPVHGCYGKLASYLTLKLASKTDERLRITNEIINGVKVIKMYAWEKPFAFLVNRAREKEVKIIRNDCMVGEICWSFESYIPRVCLFVTVLAYVLFGNNIDAEKVYLVSSYYNVLRTTVYRSFQSSIRGIVEALVSVRRVQKFLLFEEIDYTALSDNVNVNSETQDNSIAVSFANVTAKWTDESKFEPLKQMTFNIKSGSLTAIVGQVGAGKTTLFHAILREIPIFSGKMSINGKLSYSSQEAWLFASSIKQNILFGKPMDNERYDKVVEVCQLKRDFQLLPHGDNTLVGERGINLSGGQCARVNLARAVYHDADIYLLDDPLSAVDTHVGKGIFDDCIKTFLKDKTVILITHQLHYLKPVDKIIILADGAIQAEGTYPELLNSGLDLAKMMKLESESDEMPDNVQIPAKEDVVTAEPSILNPEEEEQSESRTLGNISVKTYINYFGAAKSVILVFLVVLISVMCSVLSIGGDYFVSYWVNFEETNTNFSSVNADDPLRGRSWFIYIYATLTILTIIITVAQAYTFYDMCMRVSRNLYASMFRSIVHTTMGFFNANPIGRIMNRFSKDMGIVDTRIPETILNVSQVILYTFSVLGVVSIVNPWFLIPATVIGIIVYLFCQFYIKPSRSIKRLEGITRSPVFNHLSASAHGLTTIRALHAQDILTKEFDNHQDLHSSAWFIFFSGSRAFSLYVEFLCTIFIAIVTYILLSLNNVALAGDAGLVLTQCMMVASILHWGIRQMTDLENQMTSVERVLEYSNLPPEPRLERKPDNRPPDNCPEKGRIIFDNVSLTYDRQEKPALKNLKFTVEPNEIIGIVGRTGAGKSSIINAIFRLANLEGEIYVDNLATSKISLQDLRSKISIIPQEPVLFAGSLRRNLDPFEEYNDDDLWQALGDVELKALLESDLGLNMKVMEGGSNFSVGQRQLLCLARAIVRNNKILVLDEATANVDLQTDELIQKAIRKKFNDCTVLIIAHRLNTVMDSNKILVMDAGQVMEYDHPYNLLQHKDGIFYNMVQQTGASTAESLLEIAKLNHQSVMKNLEQ